MKTLDIYLFFAGKCEEALTFYKQCLNGEITMFKRFKDEPTLDVPAEYADHVMHAEFKAGDLFFMASDGMPGQSHKLGDNIHLNIQCDSIEQQDRIFQALAKGGTVSKALEETFWGSRFGMLTDQYGIHWMLSCDLQ
ncbi:MAG: VOC family protein [Pseudomonadota bacterium]